jgi:outer membrane protein assembly factor BamB
MLGGTAQKAVLFINNRDYLSRLHLFCFGSGRREAGRCQEGAKGMKIQGILIMGIVFLFTTFLAFPAQSQWLQWGGPNRNFSVESCRLADSWPGNGPKKLWYRELGDGYSAVSADEGLLYTLYRKGRKDGFEFTVALDAGTGETVWEHRIESPLATEDDSGWGGQGPNSTPLIVGDRLYTISSTAVVHCFHKKTGKVLWKHDLVKEFHARPADYVGYAPSPLAFKDTLIVPVELDIPYEESVDAERIQEVRGDALLAFDLSSGRVKWKSQDFRTEASSPILIIYEGFEQLVLSTTHGLVGVNPEDGDLLWRHPVSGSIVTPVWNGEDIIFYSSGGTEAFALAVRLTLGENGIVPQEIWDNRDVVAMQSTPVRINDFLYGGARKELYCLNVKTGQCAWSEFGFPTATCLHADGKLIVLDENGWLTLAAPAPEELEILGRVRVTKKYSFTVPTLVGKVLYVRDRNHIMALDLG